MNRKERKLLSRELNIPLAEISKEFDEYHAFCDGVNADYRGKINAETVEVVFNELIRRSEGCRVPEARDSYLSDAALLAAVYTARCHDSNRPLPAFHARALELAELMQSAYRYARDLIVFVMLSLACLKDTDKILEHMKIVERRRNGSANKWDSGDSHLYDDFEWICLSVATREYLDADKPWDEKVKIFEYLTRLRNPNLRMNVYLLLYDLYSDTEEHMAIRNETGFPLFLDYLAKANHTPGYTIDTVESDSCFGAMWLDIAIIYAKWLYLGAFGKRSRNRKKALRILRFAAGVDNEVASQRAGFILKNLCGE